MKHFGQAIGRSVRGGEVIELLGDVGAGKTTLTKGIAEGLAITEPVQSPTFTISRSYTSPSGLRLVHYDFYRLHQAGIMREELAEVLSQPEIVTVVEWADAVMDVLPDDRLQVQIVSPAETERQVTLIAGGPMSRALQQTIEENLA